MKDRNLKNDIQNLLDLDFTQKKAVLYLKNRGYSEEEIHEEIFHFYPNITKENLRKSFLFRSSISIITLLSLLPLLGLYFHGEMVYVIVSAVLLVISFGYYKLHKICIWAWIIVVSCIVLFFLIGLFWKVSANSINSLYSYSFIISCLLFSSTVLLLVTGVHKKNKELQQQYIFKEM